MDCRTVNGEIFEFKEFDLYETARADLDFVADYSIRMRENDFVHGLAVWWDVSFNHGTTSMKISTSPFVRDTHWKQTMFFLRNEEGIPVAKDDVLTGKIGLQKSIENPRDIDIKISFKIENEEINYDRCQIYRIN